MGKALYTLVTLYVSTRIIDAIHTRHVKITALIVTKNGADVRKAIHSRLVRGITTIPATGAYTNENKEMLMMVITRYELYELERIIKQVEYRCIYKYTANSWGVRIVSERLKRDKVGIFLMYIRNVLQLLLHFTELNFSAVEEFA